MPHQLLLLLVLGSTAVLADFQIGVGMADVTGPSAEVTFMGYAKPEQKGKGIHLRQFARAFIIDDGEKRLVFVNVDAGMMGFGVHKAVLDRLQSTYEDLYSEENVIISGTHTHSGPGGFLQDLLFDITILGFVRQTFDALVDGISLSIERAHNNVVPGKIYVSKGELLEANINRSPTAYLNNPEEERAKYQYDVDKDMVQLKFVNADDKPIGVLNWFAVHGTSMNNTNSLVSSDNKGYAELVFEKTMEPNAMPGKGSFVAAFAATNLGDVSPNTAGPHCQDTGLPCDTYSSTCNGKNELCIASGPGKDMFESTKIIGERQFNKAMELFNDPNAKEVTGSLKIIHQYVDMPKQEVNYYNRSSRTSATVRGCLPAMGYSFAAGTTDGPGAFSFVQGTTTSNPLWNAVRNFLATPTPDQVECHGRKPILLPTGQMTYPFEWQPTVISTQLALVGDVAIAAVPGEFTTMSGRRLRDAIKAQAEADGGSVSEVIVAGLSNTYSDYVTTPEEYEIQRYEGASTIYGPHTLTIYLQQYRNLTTALLQGTTLDPGPSPNVFTNDLISFIPGVIYDNPQFQHEFGDVVLQPAPLVYPGDVVTTRFVAGHPRNDLRLEDTFLTVEKLESDGSWTVVATDGSWETKFSWERKSVLLGTSEVEIDWEIPDDVQPGQYRIRHFGSYKFIFGGIYPYEGATDTFEVSLWSKKKAVLTTRKDMSWLKKTAENLLA